MTTYIIHIGKSVFQITEDKSVAKKVKAELELTKKNVFTVVVTKGKVKNIAEYINYLKQLEATK